MEEKKRDRLDSNEIPMTSARDGDDENTDFNAVDADDSDYNQEDVNDDDNYGEEDQEVEGTSP